MKIYRLTPRISHLLVVLCMLTSLLPCKGAGATQQSGHPDMKRLLGRLDEIVANKAHYHKQKEAQIATLKKQAARAQGYVKANLLREIASSYAHYQTDSALVYLDQLAALPETKQSATLQAYVNTGRAEVWAVAGLYGEAIDELGKVKPGAISDGEPELQLTYYRMQRTLYGWMADYTQMPQLHDRYGERAMMYRDSLLANEGPGQSRDIVAADKATAQGQPEKSIALMLPYMKHMGEDNINPYVCFTLYQAYNALGREDECIYYLTLTAMADLQAATNEYQALPLLAQRLYARGDVQRAYNYLVCSMEDASMCKASLRTVEVSKIFPIIDKQYKAMQHQQQRNERLLTGALTLMLVLLSVACVYLRKQMKRLHASRRQQQVTNRKLEDSYRQLEDSNKQLEEMNQKKEEAIAQLQLTDKVKEEYIARYLDRCRFYIDTIEEGRRQLYRLYKERRLDDLGKRLKSDGAIKEEQAKFYADFDAAFLTLFPHFIDQVNGLLHPEGRLIPKHEGELNTELRIFALIRLGITETQRIAHFLNYSTATVYNYRSKVRNRAIGDPAQFEQQVATL